MKTPSYLVRSANIPGYQPANHHHTSGGALPHAHPGIEQSCYLLEGTAHVTVGDQAFDMLPGDMCFFPADVFHTFSVTSDTPVKLLVIYAPPYGENPRHVIRADAGA